MKNRGLHEHAPLIIGISRKVFWKDINEFKSELKRQFPSGVVDYGTLHKATPTESREWDRMGYLILVYISQQMKTTSMRLNVYAKTLVLS